MAMGSITDSSIFSQILIGMLNFMFLLIECPSCLVSQIVHSFVEVTCGADVSHNSHLSLSLISLTLSYLSLSLISLSLSHISLSHISLSHISLFSSLSRSLSVLLSHILSSHLSLFLSLSVFYYGRLKITVTFRPVSWCWWCHWNTLENHQNAGTCGWSLHGSFWVHNGTLFTWLNFSSLSIMPGLANETLFPWQPQIAHQPPWKCSDKRK